MLRKPWLARQLSVQLPYIARQLLPYRFPCRVRSRQGAWHYLSTDPVDDVVLEDMLYCFPELYFPPLSAATLRALDEGGWLLDIGAFNGSWTAEMLVRYPRARAVAVEPNPGKIKNLRRTLRASDRGQCSRIIPAALADRRGQGWLIRSSEGSWGDWIGQPDAPRPDDSLEVPTITLAEALDGVEPLVVKCNAEGAEYSVVRQMVELDLRPHLLLLMVHPEHGEPDELRDRLTRHGYELHTALDHPTRPCWHARHTRLDR